MRIAIDCHTLEVKDWAGKGHFLNTILQELIKLDSKNKYILYFRQPVFKQPLPANWQIKSIRLPTPLWQFYVLLDLLFKRVNVLFCPSAYLLPALNFLIPQVIVVCDLTTFLPEIKKTHKKGTRLREGLLLKLAAKHSRKIITISENTKRDLIRLFRVNPQKVAVVLLASHSDYRVIEDRPAIKDILVKHNLPEQFILCTGTLEPRKNIVRLIKAYADLVKKMETPPLVLVGKKGWGCQEMFATVKNLGLEKKVIFAGYIPDQDLPYIYNAASIFVYPSLYEGFGLPPLEAMACGVPVITSNISSLPEVVGPAAVLINPYNTSEISDALEKFLTNPSLREELRRQGLERTQKFSWPKTAGEILKILIKL